MITIFEKLVIGHLIGDYLIQTKPMALNKGLRGPTGFLWCILHCLIYTISVCLITQSKDFFVIALVFFSHFFIDRWSLAQKWLDLISGRNVLKAHQSNDKYREIDIAFSAIVYTVTDNTIHILLMLLIFSI